MIENYEIENIEQLRAIADILRLRIIKLLQDKPMTVTQLGVELGEAPAKVHYHVRELEKEGVFSKNIINPSLAKFPSKNRCSWLPPMKR